jgi:pyruvate dehydrogenase E2 component (dihydrolipoamide acetyltransferase)
MAELKMPSLGADMDAGRLVEWKVKPGDRVDRGTPVALVETEKATMEIESFEAGVVSELLVPAGEKVAVGTALARIADGAAAAAAAAPVPAVAPATPPRIPSSPAARRLARERGVDLAQVAAGVTGRAITLRDIEAALASGPRSAAAAPPAPAGGPAPAPEAGSRRRAPVVGGPLRDAIARAMTRSKREIPHFYLAHPISLRRALAWLDQANAHRSMSERLLPAVLLLKAVVDALDEVPELNGAWVDDGFRPSESVHLGTAISLRNGGVLAPAILDADGRSLDELMVAFRDLVARTRAGTLRPAEIASPTVTVTSLGERGCQEVWGVIHPPQVAIVGFGAIAARPWAEDGQLAVHPVVTATLACDHRVCDGHRGGLFLAAVERLLQHPETL